MLAETRDADVPLTDLGREQAEGLASWLDGGSAAVRPTTIVCSPFLRAGQTAAPLAETCGAPVLLDERLRERDRVSTRPHRHRSGGPARRGVRATGPGGKVPAHAPRGESIADVVLRVRSLMADLREGCGAEGYALVAFASTALSELPDDL